MILADTGNREQVVGFRTRYFRLVVDNDEYGNGEKNEQYHGKCYEHCIKLYCLTHNKPLVV